MSASPAADQACPRCGGPLPPRARFCPECGTPVDPDVPTRVETLPPEQLSPVSLQHAEPRWFGVAPPSLLLAVSAAALLAAIVLFGTGHWAYGLILLGVAALLLAAFLEAARRRPHQHAGTDARARLGALVEEWRARSAAAAEARTIRSGLLLLDAERRTALAELGGAAHRHDARAEAQARAKLGEIDAREAELRGRLDERLWAAGERIRRARLPVQDTVMVLPSEPSPPPGEATPPQPAVVPEPYPPPDEGTPPEPARVPEPSPDPPRED
jgi:hypothetical protein